MLAESENVAADREREIAGLRQLLEEALRGISLTPPCGSVAEETDIELELNVLDKEATDGPV